MLNEDEMQMDEFEESLAHVLHPIAPPEDFRTQLENRLRLAAQHDIEIEKENQPAFGWLVMVALLIALIGLILMRARSVQGSGGARAQG
jgi:hypothetical protein